MRCVISCLLWAGIILALCCLFPKACCLIIALVLLILIFG